jgi:glycosyltransferase involved in cell wall biosynthesis/putative flippase GtrA
MTFAKFLFVGLANTLVGLLAIYGAMYFLGFDDVPANAFGYGVGILVGFALNKRWTFLNREGVLPTLVRYILVVAIAYAVNLAIVMAVNHYFEINRYLAQSTGIVPYTLLSFLGCRYYAFRGNGDSSRNIPEASSESGLESSGKSNITAPIDLSLVIPCYNEQEVLPETVSRLADLLQGLIDKGSILPGSRVYFVDDGSRDRTWALIESLAATHPFVKGIKLSRNRGHQNALLAGLLTAEGEVIISVDADLQDDLRAIEWMLESYAAGNDVVYGVRKRRDTDTFFKRFTAQGYYHLLQAMGVDVVFDHADYRLMSRRVIESLRDFSEVNLFLRGIIPLLGYSSACVYYDRAERFAGESKYPLKKMLSFAWQGITSFSTAPLRLITGLGVFVSGTSFIFVLWIFWIRFFTDMALPGWASIVLPIYFLGGLQLLCLGIIGEYLAKVFMETKRRPRFIIEKTI